MRCISPCVSASKHKLELSHIASLKKLPTAQIGQRSYWEAETVYREKEGLLIYLPVFPCESDITLVAFIMGLDPFQIEGIQLEINTLAEGLDFLPPCPPVDEHSVHFFQTLWYRLCSVLPTLIVKWDINLVERQPKSQSYCAFTIITTVCPICCVHVGYTQQMFTTCAQVRYSGL